MKYKIKWTFFLAFCFLFSQAQADYVQRISIGAGIVSVRQPPQTFFEIGAEYEYRITKIVGIGALGNYYFSTPTIALIGAPEIFIHPFATDWLISTAPIVMFGSGIETSVGVRVGTRIPIPLGDITLIPTFAVDFINGGQNYIYGLGFQF
jgi:hypothetical protein